jgi:hypothetical protein
MVLLGQQVTPCFLEHKIEGAQVHKQTLYSLETVDHTSANTEGYDGTNFSTRPSMGTARGIFYTGGTPNASTTGTWAGGGFTNTSVANVEEFTGDTETVNIKDFTTS